MLIIYGLLISSFVISLAFVGFNVYKTYFTNSDIQFIEDEQ